MRTKKTWLLAFGLLLWTTAATAGPPNADQLYASGLRAFQNGDYKKAAVDLQAAMDAKPRAQTAVYLGNAYLKAGRLDEAKEAFSAVLKMEPDHPKRAAIEALISDIDARVEVAVKVESTPPGAKIYVDSEAKGVRGETPADLSVTVGAHTIIVARDGYETTRREEVLVANKPVAIKIDLHGRGCDVSLAAEGPAAARASIDGADTVPLPSKVLVRQGEHKIVFTAPTYETQTLPLSCDGFKPASLDPVLVLQQGRLSIPSGPGTVVRIDGKLVSVSAEQARGGVGLAPGRHEVAVTVGDEPTRISFVDVGAGESIQLGLPAEKGAGAFGSRLLYFQLHGGGNIALRDWALGSNAFRAQSGETRVNPGSSAMAGVVIGFQVTPRIAVETEIDWMSLPNQIDTSNGISYTANVLYHLLPGKMTPIVEGGVGAYQVVSGQLGTDVAARAHLGVGFRGRVAKWLALRADARDVVSKGFEPGGANNLELFAGGEVLLR
jgi:hypothetical protein